jgi:DNA-binding XRE family transcriptional regulator
MYKNPYLGSDVKSSIAKQLKNEEFAEAFELERERLRIAHSVRTLREKKRITQTQLAELIGTKQPSIARLEAVIWPRIDMLRRLLGLGCSARCAFRKRRPNP